MDVANASYYAREVMFMISLGSADIDSSLEEQTTEDSVVLNSFTIIVNTLGKCCQTYLKQIDAVFKHDNCINLIGRIAEIGKWILICLKVQERQLRICTTVAITIISEKCSPFTILPGLMNEYRVEETNVQNGVLCITSKELVFVNVCDVYWKVYNTLHVSAQDSLATAYPRMIDENGKVYNYYGRYELDYIL